MKIQVAGAGQHQVVRVGARCPHCGREAVLDRVGEHDLQVARDTICGQRKCPHPSCAGHLFVVIKAGQIVASYPPLRLDFNSENLPARILKSFSEAISCHAAECYVAAALMVRRTLEELCEERGASGANLKARLNDLKGKIVIPQELFEAMDELRLLGNDAAHIEAKDYDAISAEEIVIAIEFTKEILKGVYQYSTLLAKMRALKKSP